MSRYSIRVAWSEQDEMFVAVCPELGDLSALGRTRHDAVAELEQAIELALETYDSEGWPLPDACEVESFSGQFRLRLPRSLHAWLSHEAERQSVSLNSLVTATLSQAKGSTETQTVITERINSALSNLKTSIHSSIRSAITEFAEDSSVSWDSVSKPEYDRHQDSLSTTLRLIEDVS